MGREASGMILGMLIVLAFAFFFLTGAIEMVRFAIGIFSP